MMQQVLNSVIPKIVICQCLADQLFAEAEGTYKSRYFAQPPPIIANFFDDIYYCQNNDNDDDSNIPYGVFIDSKTVIQGMLAHSPVKLITTGEVKNSTVVLVIGNKSEIKEAHISTKIR